MSYSKGSELLFKVLIVGEGGTGKTCLIRRYVHNIFLTTNKATIGVDFALKDFIHPLTNQNITLQLWDIAGQERYGHMTRVYYQGAIGAFIVVDITRPETLELAIKWKKDLDHKIFLDDSGKTIPCILLINKLDLIPNSQLASTATTMTTTTTIKSGGSSKDKDKHYISINEGSSIQKTKEEMNSFCNEYGFETWFVTSAKENKNVDIAFQILVDLMLKATGTLENNNSNKGNITDTKSLYGNRAKREQKSGCAC